MASAEVVSPKVWGMCNAAIKVAWGKLEDVIDNETHSAVCEVLRYLAPRKSNGEVISVDEIRAKVNLYELKNDRYLSLWWWCRDLITQEDPFELEAEDLAGWREVIEQQFAD
jgi:hypothetical protein